MAALYLHNALFMPEKQEPPPPQRLQPQGPQLRHISSNSSVTLKSQHPQHPNDPLAPDTTGLGFSELELSDRASQRESNAGGNLEPGYLRREDSNRSEEKTMWPPSSMNRVRRIRLWSQILLAAISSWTLYNTIRYFLSFPHFLTQERQLFALLLGACTTVALALIAASLLLNLLSFPFDSAHDSILQLTKEIFLPYAASLCVLTPAVINFALVFIWRHSPVDELTIQGRCHWDVDLIWSSAGMQCLPPNHTISWAAWVVGAVFRLLFTLGFIGAYHALRHKYTQVRRLVQESPRIRFPAGHHHRDSSIAHIPNNRATQSSHTVVSSTIHPPPATHRSKHHRTHSNGDDLESGLTVPKSEASHRSHLTKITPGHSPTTLTGDLTGSLRAHSTCSEDTLSGPEPIAGAPPGLNHPDSSSLGFANRFRAIVDQIAQETEEAIHLASPTPRTSGADDDYAESADEEDDYDDGGEYDPYSNLEFRVPATGNIEDWDYDEFGNPLPSGDYQLNVFGRPVHRMPTIESLGSREGRNSVAAYSLSLHHLDVSGSPSLVPTRSNTVSDHDASSPMSTGGRKRSCSWGDIRPSSRQAIRMASELGELPLRRTPDLCSPTHSRVGTNSTGSNAVGGGSQSTTSITFYSATDSPTSFN